MLKRNICLGITLLAISILTVYIDPCHDATFFLFCIPMVVAMLAK